MEMLAEGELVLVRRYAAALPTLKLGAVVGGRKGERLAVVCPTPSLSPTEGEDCQSVLFEPDAFSSFQSRVLVGRCDPSRQLFFFTMNKVFFNILP